MAKLSAVLTGLGGGFIFGGPLGAAIGAGIGLLLGGEVPAAAGGSGSGAGSGGSGGATDHGTGVDVIHDADTTPAPKPVDRPNKITEAAKQMAFNAAKKVVLAVAGGMPIEDAIGSVIPNIGGGAVIAFDIAVFALAVDTMLGGNFADQIGETLQSLTGGGMWSGLSDKTIAWIKAAPSGHEQMGRYMSARGIHASDLKSIVQRNADGSIVMDEGGNWVYKDPEEIQYMLLGVATEHEERVARDLNY